jgi:hypothetical protein
MFNRWVPPIHHWVRSIALPEMTGLLGSLWPPAGNSIVTSSEQASPRAKQNVKFRGFFYIAPFNLVDRYFLFH